MTWDRLPPMSTYPKAHRKELYRRLSRVIRGDDEDLLVPFEEVRERLGLWQQSYGGVRTIRVDDIVGTAARSSDFTEDWLPKGDHIRRRWEGLERAFPDGDFPPIQVYEVNGGFYVIDGHHRVAVAKQRGIEFLDAEVTEIHTDLEITPDMDFRSLLHLQQHRAFMDQSGLRLVRPKAEITVTQPVGYRQLLEHVRIHGYHLMMERGEVLSREAVAADWYDRTFEPTAAAIRHQGLDELMDDRTVADIFLWIHQRRRLLLVEDDRTSYEDVVRSEASAKKAKSLPGRTKSVMERVERAVEDVVDRIAGPDD
ncbi:MAG: ParB N-terminal domain-containing protein [Acidimicrobiia bacterium]|nr:ParB N-terminal domain-containing protein [Acidimicrobiia bacterium]